ncbi:MAG: adventurous gliding motility protein GltC [Deltaproteobacteria bacterium]|nr:adventurous gliding motility protein GltC [Deltaproteobacteria bacterium]
MKRASTLVLALVTLLGFAPRAHAAVLRQLANLASSQMSFDGLDLTSDEKPSKGKKGKKTKAKKGKKGKNSKEEEESTPSAAPDLGSSPAPTPSPSPTTSAPSTPTKATPASATPMPDLGVSTPAPKKTEPSKPAPTMSFEAIDVTGKSAERQKLDAAVSQFKAQKYDDAALALEEIIKDPKNAELVPEARYLLAKTLYRMGLYHSALAQFNLVLATGPQSKFFKTSLEWLFYIAHKTVNEEIVLDTVAKYANYEFPPKFQSEFHYLLAKYHFERGKALLEAGRQQEGQNELDQSNRLVLAFNKSDPFYGKAKYIEGLIQFDLGKEPVALEAFKEVVRANNPKSGQPYDEKLRELGFMQLARTHYGNKQNRYAIYYFEKIPAGSDQWLESLFEASWAHFRIGQYEKALGNMITLQAPFFRDEYFPEALILKAVIYYENCRYKESRAILDDFEKIYGPVHDQLDKITKDGEASNADAQHYFDILEDIEKKMSDGTNNDVVLGRVLKLALTDRDLKSTNDSILETEHEMDSLSKQKDVFKFSDLSKELGDGLKKERQQLIQRAGLIAKAKLQHELQYLKELLSQGLRIQFETTTKEKELIESSLTGGGKKEGLSTVQDKRRIADEEEMWPYEGEYWRDELGTYEYTLTKSCKDFLTSKTADSGSGAN